MNFSAKPGRVVGPVLPLESGRSLKDWFNSIKELDNGHTYSHNPVLPPQGISPHYAAFRTTTNSGKNQEKYGPEVVKASSQIRVPHMQQSESDPKLTQKTNTGVINSNPYYQSQVNVGQLNSQMVALDAKLMQAQSQFGAAVAVAAHREVGAVQFGLT